MVEATLDVWKSCGRNHRLRQLAKMKSVGTVVREMAYDAFGRMILQVDAPGTDDERGTIFIPNIGFGGGGHGADTAGEISYQGDSGTREATEVVQYTCGLGTIGGGIGWKRVLEFVAYGGSDFKPYYRFLHEDTMVSTVATTDLSGDRRDEIDYTDYGIPMHAPILLDGRHVTGVTPGGTNVSEVSLSVTPQTASLVGREFRLTTGPTLGWLSVPRLLGQAAGCERTVASRRYSCVRLRGMFACGAPRSL